MSLLKKTTTFRGRLGYACLNTVLRNKKPAKDSVFCSRTCRLSSLQKNGIQWVKDLGSRNVQDLLTMIQWNEDNHIRFLRISSEMFPFASHAIHGYSLDYCAPLLAQVGDIAKRYGHRLTTHPGQYTQLGSPRPHVVQSAVRELVYHCEMLDRMGIDHDGVMIIHGGGVYDDKQATLDRIKKSITQVLPANVRARLVLENDELCYSAEDLLPLCEELDVPLVFDYHHDTLNPSSIPPSSIIRRANAIFARRGIRPKQHLSEPRPGAETLMEKRAHADRCENLPPDLPDDMDLMIEAKDKEQAVLHLYQMYDLHPVNSSSVRPPDENPTKETKGRKSSKRLRPQIEQEAVPVQGDPLSPTTLKNNRKERPAKRRRTQTEKVGVEAEGEADALEWASPSLNAPPGAVASEKKARKDKLVKRRHLRVAELEAEEENNNPRENHKERRGRHLQTEIEDDANPRVSTPLFDAVTQKKSNKKRPGHLEAEQVGVEIGMEVRSTLNRRKSSRIMARA